MKMNSVCRAVRIAVFLAALPAATAQLNRGTVTGVVRDPSGAVIANAAITATHVETNTKIQARATSTGDYTLSGLDIGVYKISALAPGFRREETKVTVDPGATVRFDFAMQVGAATDSIEVSARAALLETDSTQNSTNINNKLVGEIPIVVNGGVRSIMNLATLAPEARSTGGGLRIGGGQSAGYDVIMDGGSLTSGSSAYQEARVQISSVPLDAVSELAVETSGLKAENGRAMGVISLVSKSGTNEYHGSLFEFLRNNAMDARGFFAAATPILKQHDFGATAGGPVRVPKLYNGRNRTFFFASYEGFRNRSGGNPQFLSVPLPEMYNGDFSNWIRGGKLAPIYDPGTTRLAPSGSGYVRDAFAGNIIPPSRFSTVAKNIIGLRSPGMVPNLPGITSNYYTASGSNVAPSDKGSIRIDHQLSAKDRISFLYTRGQLLNTWSGINPPGLPNPYNGAATTLTANASGRWNWDRIVNPSTVNNLRVTYQREHGDGVTIDAQDPVGTWNAKIGLKNTPGPDHNFIPLSFSGLTGWGAANWGGDRGRDLSINDDVTFTKGKHTFKGGVQWGRDTWIGVGQHRPNGSFGFSYLATAVPGDQSQNTGASFASFLLGYPDTTGLETPRAVMQRWPYMATYFQDDWRVTSKLTVNVGLRWEYTWAVSGGALLGLKDWNVLDSYTEGGFSNFNPSVANPGAGGIAGAVQWSGSGQGACNCSLFDTYKKAFGPRLGIAWNVRAGTVIRVSAGRTFAPVKSSGGSTHFEGLILNTNWSSNDLDTLDFPTLLDKGLPAWTPPPFRDPSFSNGTTTYFWQKSDAGRPPVLDQWNFQIQQELKHSFVVSATYTGTKGTHLDSAIANINQINPKYIQQYGLTLLRSNIASAAARAANIPIPYAGFNSTVQRALSAFPQYQDVATNGGQPASVGERAGNSTYHALILKADKRYSSGLTMLASYSFSKILDDADTAQITGRGVLDTFNRKLEKSLAGDDQTHVVRLSYSYELPFGKGRRYGMNRLADVVIGRWNLAGNQSYSSGTPLTVTTSISPIGTGNRVFISSHDNWRASSGNFDPGNFSTAVGCKTATTTGCWWNLSSFQQVPAGVDINSVFGNAARNNPKARTNWSLNESFSLQKEMHITEKRFFTLRFEAFNIFNRVRWGAPDSSVNSTTFGRVNSQGNTPRQLQASLRFQF